LTQGKPVLYLKYLHENITQYEEMGACWTIHDEDELKKAIRALRKNKSTLPYASENVSRFLSEVVYGGQPAGDVLGNYVKFIAQKVVNSE
jgi:hypothetical protein